MAFSLRRRDPLPAEVRSALDLGDRERVLSWARDDTSGAWVVATNHHLCAVEQDGEPSLARAWHLVDAGTWSSDLFQLTVTWVDGARPRQWVFHEPTLLPETLRERVQASVVLAQQVTFGTRRSGRVVLRQDLATGELVDQVLLGRGVRPDDPGVQAAVDGALAYLREQVGLT
ncbi:MAG TPA: hypothetical protein VGK60_02950 [Pedococcus sp.]|jgi:hypothetical protein